MTPASRLLRRKETTMITLYDHIQELKAELRGCYFTRRERAAVQAELANAIAGQAELDRAFDLAVEALYNGGGTPGPPSTSLHKLTNVVSPRVHNENAEITYADFRNEVLGGPKSHHNKSDHGSTLRNLVLPVTTEANRPVR
jgi:coproporphyrinogen III oxidase-like Fe-S oxidoreductase